MLFLRLLRGLMLIGNAAVQCFLVGVFGHGWAVRFNWSVESSIGEEN